MSIKAFAKLGIMGLRDRDTVTRYYDAWDDTKLPADRLKRFAAAGRVTEQPQPPK